MTRKTVFALSSLISILAIGAGICACDCGGNEIEKHGHNYIETVTEPTCLHGGYTTYNCECGKNYTDDYTEPLGHDYDGDTCTRCGYVRHDHDYEQTVVEPTCTERGYTRGVCKICGATYTLYNADPLGHDYDNGWCTRCDNFDSDKHEHEYTQTITEPDCTKQGYTTYTCDCGYSYVGDTSFGEHDYVDGRCTLCNRLIHTEGLEFTLSDDDTYCLTGMGTATDTDLVIPSVYNGKPVSEIDYYFWRGMGSNYNLTSVTIPDSVTTLTVINDIWVYIGYNDVIVYVEAKSKPDGWYTNWNYAKWRVVWDCKDNDIADDGNIYTIKGRVRYALKDGCASVDKVPKNLKDLILPQSIFYNSNFYEVRSISSNVVVSSLFISDKDLTSVTIPDSVVTIDEMAFYNCTNLTNIIIGKNVAAIGKDAFFNCSSLTSITVVNGNKSYHSKDNCLIETASNTLVLGCKNSVIPDDGSVTSIAAKAFLDIESLTDVTIPACITFISQEAFYSCSNLTSIRVAEGNTHYYSEGNCLITTEYKTLILGCQNSVIPDGVTAIGQSAFTGCYGLKSVTIPSSVTWIGDFAFQQCRALNEVTISDGVKVIGRYAFAGCPLTDAVIPESVTTIGDSAFLDCNLSGITIGSSVKEIGRYAFSGCKYLRVITYYGTEAEWQAIVKGTGWDNSMPEYTVNCIGEWIWVWD